MRTFITFLLLFVLPIVIFAQDIPNNSFEQWTVASAGHEDPDSWSTANSTTNVFPINKITTEKTNDSFEGDYAAMLSSKTVLTFVAPGFVTLGDFSIDLWTQVTSITGGIAYNLRPAKLKVWYKYTPATGDNMRIGMWMLRTEGFEVPDTVAIALFNGGDLVSDYTQLIIDVEYRNEFNPELLNIIAVSSNPDGPVAGSVLYIDKFELEYSTGIISNTQSELSIYPNPVCDYLILTDYFNDCSYSIIDINGRVVSKGNYSVNEHIYISDFSNGVYIISVVKDGINHTQKFIK